MKFKNFKAGLTSYFYWKDSADSAISISEASKDTREPEWETDIHLNYKMFQDTTFYILYGSFFPGKAFEDRQRRDYFMATFTLSF